MEIFFLLIGCSILVALIFLAGFLWSVSSGQYDDVYTPSVRMLFDQDGEVVETVEKEADEKPDAGQFSA